MSKLHVTQIEGYLRGHLDQLIEMEDYANHYDQAQVSNAFLSRSLGVLAISIFTEAPLSELAPYVTDGPGDGGIDAIYFDPKDGILYLVQTKWHGDGHGSIELGDALKFIEGVKKVLDNDIDNLNEKIKARKGDIHRAIFDANSRFALVLAHTGQENLGKEVSAAFKAYADSQNDTSELMSFHVLNQAELHKAVAAGVAGAPVSVEVQLANWGQIREPHFGVYGQVFASDVSSWMEQYGSRLFERNLRQFLGSSTVNQDIVATLIARPEEFWYFNNGITAIATALAKKPVGGNSTDSGIFECEGFCVVNGAQTVGSIHAATAQAPESAGKAKVLIRIISSSNSPDVFSTEVTRFTNTQNAIERRDFVALDPEQERISAELRIEGVEYAYKAGSLTGANTNRFDLSEATVALACTNPDLALAVQAKREIGRLWEDIGKSPYKQLFNASITGPLLWDAVCRVRKIDAALQVTSQNYSGRDSLICTHGNRFIQWAAHRRLVNEALEVADVVAKVVVDVIAAVKTEYADSYPASLFKNQAKCKRLADRIGL